MLSKEEIKSKLPRGYSQIIATKAGVTKAAVSKYFNDITKVSPTIEKAALECAIEYQQGLSKLVTAFKAL